MVDLRRSGLLPTELAHVERRRQVGRARGAHSQVSGPTGAIMLARDNSIAKWVSADKSMPCDSWYGCYWMPLRAPKCTALAANALESKGRKSKGHRAAEQALSPTPRRRLARGLLVPAGSPMLFRSSARMRARSSQWGPFLMVSLLDAWWRPSPVFGAKLKAAVDRILRVASPTGAAAAAAAAAAWRCTSYGACRTE